MNVLWLQSGGCGGCSMSLLCADTADFPAMLQAGGIELLWHPSLSLASGRELIALLEACRDGKQRLDVLCVEGSLLRGPKVYELFSWTDPRPMLRAAVNRVVDAAGRRLARLRLPRWPATAS